MKFLPFCYFGSIASIPVVANSEVFTNDWSKLSSAGLLSVIAGGALWLMYKLAAQHIGEGMSKMSDSIDKVTVELNKLNAKLDNRPCMIVKERKKE